MITSHVPHTLIQFTFSPYLSLFLCTSSCKSRPLVFLAVNSQQPHLSTSTSQLSFHNHLPNSPYFLPPNSPPAKTGGSEYDITRYLTLFDSSSGCSGVYLHTLPHGYYFFINKRLKLHRRG